MPILLYIPKSKGGPYRDATLSMPGVTRVVLSEKIGVPYLPAAFDGRLILCTHGLRERPVVLTPGGKWLDSSEFMQRYDEHFQYLKDHVKRVDLFICHTGYSGFGAAFAHQLKNLVPAGRFVVNAPTAQFTIEENQHKWRIGMGQVLPYVFGLSELFAIGNFDRYASPFVNMAWAGYPKLRRNPHAKADWTALSKTKTDRSSNLGSAWFGFGFNQFSVTSIGSQLTDAPAKPDLGELAKFFELPDGQDLETPVGQEQSELQKALWTPDSQGLGDTRGREQSVLQRALGISNRQGPGLR